MKILVETSARHCHLSDADLKRLFGPEAELICLRELSQPGQFASEQRVDIVGPKSTIKNLMVIGPTRAQTQVEVSLTDARSLGVPPPPIRESGKLAGSAPIKIVGPKGEIELTEGLIVAQRHIHATPEDAVKLGVTDQEIVNVEVKTPQRSAIFGDVVVRVSPTYATAMHLDTDESNAVDAASCDAYGVILR